MAEERETVGAIKSENFADASRAVLDGQHVDVSHLFVTKERSDLNSDGYDREIHQITQGFNDVADIVNSPDFADFKDQLTQTLENAQGQLIVLDVEEVLANPERFTRLTDKDGNRPDIYYPNPWMIALGEVLMQNGNEIVLWTAAEGFMYRDNIEPAIGAMAALNCITRKEWLRITKAYASYNKNTADAAEVVDIIRAVNPNSRANEEDISAAAKIFSRKVSRREPNDLIPEYVRGFKIPQIVFPEDDGIMIDDSTGLSDSLRGSHWVPITIESNPGNSETLQIAHQIAMSRQ